MKNCLTHSRVEQILNPSDKIGGPKPQGCDIIRVNKQKEHSIFHIVLEET